MNNVIYSYTRAQAIEDGVLVDLTTNFQDVCKDHFNFPIACTSTVWNLIEKAVNNKKHFNDFNGVIHDILWMSKMNRVKTWKSGCLFKVIITGTGRQKIHLLKFECHGGDNSEPVITIMMPNED